VRFPFAFLKVGESNSDFSPTKRNYLNLLPLAAGQCELNRYSVARGTLVRYPPLAQQAQISGEVIVSFDLDSDGNPDNMRVLSGPALLGDETVQMVRSWKLRLDDQVVTSVKGCRVLFNYSILFPAKDPGCNTIVRPQMLNISFVGASRVQVTESPRFMHICDSF